jgi:hypothetical protein
VNGSVIGRGQPVFRRMSRGLVDGLITGAVTGSAGYKGKTSRRSFFSLLNHAVSKNLARSSETSMWHG